MARVNHKSTTFEKTLTMILEKGRVKNMYHIMMKVMTVDEAKIREVHSVRLSLSHTLTLSLSIIEEKKGRGR